MFGSYLHPERKEEAEMETLDRHNLPHNGPEYSLLEDSYQDPAFEEELSWPSSRSEQFYTQHTLPSHISAATYTAETTTYIAPTQFHWDNSGSSVHNSYETISYIPDQQGVTDGYEECPLFPLRSSTPTTDNIHLSHPNEEIFNPSSPTTTTSESSTASPDPTSLPVPPSSKSSSPTSSRRTSNTSTGSEEQDPITCSNCTTHATSLWRRDPDGRPICNACGLFLKLHGIPRPLSLKTDVVKTRKRERVVSGSATRGRAGGGGRRGVRKGERRVVIAS